MRRHLVLAVFCVFFAFNAQAQRFRLVVGSPNFQPFPVAVTHMGVESSSHGSTDSLANNLTNYLRENVEIARSLELVPPVTYLDSDSFSKPNFQSFRNIGALGLIRSTIKSDGSNVQLSFKFYDIASQRELLARTYNETSATASFAVGYFLDDLIELLTGERGIYSSQIAYVKRIQQGKAVFVCNIDGRNSKQLTPNHALSLLPAWDSNNLFVFFTSYIKGNPDLYRINVRTNHIDLFSAKRGLNTGASVSQDGKKIALTLSMDGNTEIYSMNPDGTELKRLTNSFGQDVSPTFSPDGKRIAFVSSRSGNPHIYVMNADGTNSKRLTFQGNYNQEPDWSPKADGQIAFTGRDERLKYDLFLVHPNTAEITRLTQDSGNNESPSHSPDGQLLVFTSTRDPSGQKRLFITDIDGTRPQAISREVGDFETPSWSRRKNPSP